MTQPTPLYKWLWLCIVITAIICLCFSGCYVPVRMVTKIERRNAAERRNDTVFVNDTVFYHHYYKRVVR